MVEQKEVHAFFDQVAQGDVWVKRVSQIPTNFKLVAPVDNKYIVPHIESAHHHVINVAPGVEYYQDDTDEMDNYLQVIDEVEVRLEHLKSVGGHATIALSPGIFRLRRVRERTPTS